METVLVVGASGNIGVSVIIGALRSGYKVLAVVRNKASADKIFKHVGTTENITTVEADVMSDSGISHVVEQVRVNRLPAFQHVYSTVLNPTTPLESIAMETFRNTMHVNLEANYLAYRATVPYLLEQGNPNSTWTLVTGGAGEFGSYGVTSISQGALFSMANVACKENASTNIRFNEVYLCCRVDYDSVVDEKGGNRMKASEFARVYEKILAEKQVKGCRVSVYGSDDVDKLKYNTKFDDSGAPRAHTIWRGD